MEGILIRSLATRITALGLKQNKMVGGYYYRLICFRLHMNLLHWGGNSVVPRVGVSKFNCKAALKTLFAQRDYSNTND